MLNYALILLIIRTLLLRIDELTKTSVGFMQELTFTGVRGFLKPCKDINLQIMLGRPNVIKSQRSKRHKSSFV